MHYIQFYALLSTDGKKKKAFPHSLLQTIRQQPYFCWGSSQHKKPTSEQAVYSRIKGAMDLTISRLQALPR